MYFLWLLDPWQEVTQFHALASMIVPSPKIFPYARSSALIDDPSGALQAAASSDAFASPCPHPTGSPAVTKALAERGKLPVNSAFGGLGGGRVILGIVGLVMTLTGVVCALLRFTRGAPSIVVALVLLLIGVLLVVVTVYSARQRSRNLHQLGMAWRNGWVRFAPARVGGVWVSSATRHNGPEDHTHEVRYKFRAIVEVLPTDGGESFTITTAEFSAPADADGQPYDLISAENPLDVLEPEHFNGWTIARYLAHDPHGTATISTDLSAAQIKAAVQVVAGHH